MLAKSLTDARALLGKHVETIIFVAVISSAAYVFARVAGTNPVILGDEWIYSVNAVVASPWGPTLAGDYSNYLFSLVFKVTSLCGPQFYSCAKLVNVLFHASSILLLSATLRPWVPGWVRGLLAVSLVLGPSGVYTSMFLPESMFMFFMVVSFAQFSVLSRDFSRLISWALLGAVIGASSLVKPHGLFMAVAVGVFWLVLVVSPRWAVPVSRKFLAAGAFVSATLLSRLLLGFLAGGPKTLSFFGSYVNESTINAAISGTKISDLTPTPYDSPMSAVLDLFPSQLWNLTASVYGVAAVAISALILWLATLGKRPTDSGTSQLDSMSLFVVIWLFTMVIVIAAFSGWATGTGDDHSLRVLFRYFDFLVPVVIFLGAAVILRQSYSGSGQTLIQSIGVMALFLAVGSYTFSGFPASVSIQIADAPYLAGLVVEPQIFFFIGSASALVTLAVLFFKRLAGVPAVAFLAVVSIALGSVAHDQYRFFRGEQSGADKAGQFAATVIDNSEHSGTTIIANSRFDATTTAFWMQTFESDFLYVSETSLLQTSELPIGTSWAILVGDVGISGRVGQSYYGPGYVVQKVLGPNEQFFDAANSFPGLWDASGLSSKYTWGSWVLGEAKFRVPEPIPASSFVDVVLRVDRAQIGGIITVSLGSNEQSIIVDETQRPFISSRIPFLSAEGAQDVHLKYEGAGQLGLVHLTLSGN